ncbi:hypothetical protein PR202_ga29779 [Eleusine coracana subsp. coracana]|uniref:Late embryogenesis abundant protein LEA-2 subgroup domain-containing protein n=1 Tax=Eleusine coracana subsp. coracana TaxID=191504 RepID=A0AAV5DKK8_ELECO|nr:hypothetical protein PR202_ga29779 [Eleusine coracana subsp. coracana]
MAKTTKRAGLIFCHVLLPATAITLAALYFAVLRGRRPQATAATHTRLNHLNLNAYPPQVNLTLAVLITLRNPNHAAFRHGEAVTTVTYHNTTVGGGGGCRRAGRRGQGHPAPTVPGRRARGDAAVRGGSGGGGQRRRRAPAVQGERGVPGGVRRHRVPVREGDRLPLHGHCSCDMI